MKPQTKAFKIAGEAEQQGACLLSALPRFPHWSSRWLCSLHPAGVSGLNVLHVCQISLKLGLAEEGGVKPIGLKWPAVGAALPSDAAVAG